MIDALLVEVWADRIDWRRTNDTSPSGEERMNNKGTVVHPHPHQGMGWSLSMHAVFDVSSVLFASYSNNSLKKVSSALL